MTASTTAPVQLLRVDMTHMRVEAIPLPAEWLLLGGRALTARILLDECDATCDPLGPDNVLIFAGGALEIHKVPEDFDWKLVESRLLKLALSQNPPTLVTTRERMTTEST